MPTRFFCNLKEDYIHTLQDQSVFWGIRAGAVFLQIKPDFPDWEQWLFTHGWLLLLGWRILNAMLDTYKRLRDVRKPEWDTQVKPVLKREAVEDRKRKGWAKVWHILAIFLGLKK